jgi:hypothetical protein
LPSHRHRELEVTTIHSPQITFRRSTHTHTAHVRTLSAKYSTTLVVPTAALNSPQRGPKAPAHRAVQLGTTEGHPVEVFPPPPPAPLTHCPKWGWSGCAQRMGHHAKRCHAMPRMGHHAKRCVVLESDVTPPPRRHITVKNASLWHMKGSPHGSRARRFAAHSSQRAARAGRPGPGRVQHGDHAAVQPLVGQLRRRPRPAVAAVHHGRRPQP